jgi:peptidyl-prolyl cis-trans isomerase B (cyclophilin B)
MIRPLALLLLVGLAMGCRPQDETAPAMDAPPPPEEPAEELASSPTAAPGATAPNEGDEVAILETNHGRIVLKFFPDRAPKHVENFKKLAKEGFYDGTRFHRVIPGFMIQGGDPNSRKADRSLHGSGGPGYTIDAEFNATRHTAGILSAARTGDPNSAGSQFFIVHETSTHLDRQYTAYGQVIEGMDVVDTIANLPTGPGDNPIEGQEAIVERVRIVTWPLEEEEETPQ